MRRSRTDQQGGVGSFILWIFLWFTITTEWCMSSGIHGFVEDAAEFNSDSLLIPELIYHTRPSPTADSIHADEHTHWIRWSVPAPTSTMDSTFTLFAEWAPIPSTAENLTSDLSSQPQRRKQQQQLRRIRKQVCQLSYKLNDKHDSSTEWLECDISHLPREVELSFVLHTLEVEPQPCAPILPLESNIHTTTAASSPHFTLSPSLLITLPAEPKVMTPVPIPLVLPSTTFASNITIARIFNDTEVRDDLMTFYDLTNGPNWGYSGPYGWSNVSVCDWMPDVFGCDLNRTKIIAMDFFDLTIILETVAVDFNFLFVHITTLLEFSCAAQALQFNGLDFSNQIYLQTIAVGQMGRFSCENALSPLILPMHLPQIPSPLLSIDMYQTCLFIVNIVNMTFPVLQTFRFSDVATPVPLAVLVDNMPALMDINGDNALESQTPDKEGRSGPTLTHYWLENLNQLHPQLWSLSISGCTSLDFGANFPIVHSNSLSTLIISHNTNMVVGTLANDTLSYLPQLGWVDFSFLRFVPFDLTLFEMASTTVLHYLALSSTNVQGSLLSLSYHPHLQVIQMRQCSLYGSLPSNMAQLWPNLTMAIFDSNILTGSVPSFANMPYLVEIDLHSNQLSNILPIDFLNNSLTNLQEINLGDNQITGNLPNFRDMPFLSSLNMVAFDHNQFTGPLDFLFSSEAQVLSTFPSLYRVFLQNNGLTGSVPKALWSLQSTLYTTILLNSNNLTGTIPSPAQPTSYLALSLSNNPGLWGPFPDNLTATIFSLSYTQLSGPVRLTFGGHPSLQRLNLAFTQLTCPLDLSLATDLRELDIQSAGFSGCDIRNQTQMNINWNVLECQTDRRTTDQSGRDSLSSDGIHRAQHCVIVFSSFPYLSSLFLRSLRRCHTKNDAQIRSRDHVTPQPYSAENCGLFGLAVQGYLVTPINLQALIISNNALLDYSSDQFKRIFKSANALTIASFQNCSLGGSLHSFLDMNFAPLLTLSKLSLGSNQFVGVIPFLLFADNHITPYALPTSIQELDLSNNVDITGYLPPAVPAYAELQVIDISGTSIIGPLPESWSTLINLQRLSAGDTFLTCDATTVMCPLPSWLVPSPLTSPSTTIPGAHCPLLVLNSPFTLVDLPEEYYHHSLCTCDEKYFGSSGVCQSCPIGCTCHGDMIQGCFPILVPQYTYETNIAVPFVIPCPLSVTGTTLCNPYANSWTSFDPNLLASVTTASSSYDFSQLNLTNFCSTGHTSRLCSKCQEGYFASGRWCLVCSSNVVHVIIIFLNIGILAFLIMIIFQQLPSPRASLIQLQLYINRSHGLASSSRMASDSFSHIRRRAASIDRVIQRARASSASPLKLLIFHSQQLSLLLSTATSQPQILTSFVSLVSSTSTGFSLSSLVSLECLHHLWSIQHKVWMSLLAPALVCLACGLIYLYQRSQTAAANRHRHPSEAINGSASIQIPPDSSFASESSTISPASFAAQLDEESEAAPRSRSSNVPRLYGVCLALLYFFLFPCAQTVLSALACTDSRQYDSSAAPGASSLYLNLLPWIACDSQWQSTILPLAIIGVFVWVIAFPIVTTIFTYYLFSQIRLNHANVHLWPLCADLFTRFKARYWYYEQILLLRRLALVGCVTLIPNDSLYQPVILFSIIQFSALLQHQMWPYESVWLNRGELASLYLFLLNYITALVLHETSSGEVNGHSLDNWSIILFFLNLVFLLLLICGLFVAFRTRLLQLIQKCQSCLKRMRSTTTNSNDSDSIDRPSLKVNGLNTDFSNDLDVDESTTSPPAAFRVFHAHFAASHEHPSASNRHDSRAMEMKSVDSTAPSHQQLKAPLLSHSDQEL